MTCCILFKKKCSGDVAIYFMNFVFYRNHGIMDIVQFMIALLSGVPSYLELFKAQWLV